ncbi:hypothetical protein DPEC_G00188380 [Dallia pectoralis]|uniref:Uncharacterized protein n=1 Tax=Dallia pectoralis TaxID=75939 RepID=A0ACC2GCB9_DALPE|nr:hypothetical protein DPEC_G00188380 [Dallia pectoralis]
MTFFIKPVLVLLLESPPDVKLNLTAGSPGRRLEQKTLGPVNLTFTREKRVGPRIEPCGTPMETALGSNSRHSDLLDPVGEIIGEPGEAVERETQAVESADENTMVNQVECLGQVNVDGCTVVFFVNGGYDVIRTFRVAVVQK